MGKAHTSFFLLTSAIILLLLVLFACNLLFGSVSIPFAEVWSIITGGEAEKESWRYIVLESRLPQAITAILCGASLAVSGLLLQTSFRNPLAGPSILGITNGASLGVAIVMLIAGGTVAGTGGNIAVVLGALIGSLAVIVLLLFMASIIHSNIMLLIVGIMVSFLVSSIVSLTYIFANADNVHAYVMWGMGSFSDVTVEQLPWFGTVSFLALVLAITLIKPLNALLLGDDYAQNLGINLHKTRWMILLSTGILTAIATAYCGPVAFLGLATPHIARLMLRTGNHIQLLPTTILTGAVMALACNLLCIIPSVMMPLNAVTPIFGVPVILYIIIRRRDY